MKKNIKSVNIDIVSCEKVDCVVHFLRLYQCDDVPHKVHETTTDLLVTLPNIHRFKKIFFTNRLIRNLPKANLRTVSQTDLTIR